MFARIQSMAAKLAFVAVVAAGEAGPVLAQTTRPAAPGRPELARPYVARLISDYLTPRGALLVAEYRSRRDTSTAPWVDCRLQDWGFRVPTRAIVNSCGLAADRLKRRPP